MRQNYVEFQNFLDEYLTSPVLTPPPVGYKPKTRYELALATADFLETFPQYFRYSKVWVPEHYTQYGCLLGHMGRIAGVKPRTDVGLVSRPLTGITDLNLYNWLALVDRKWISCGRSAAHALRVLAKIRNDKQPYSIPSSMA